MRDKDPRVRQAVVPGGRIGALQIFDATTVSFSGIKAPAR
jgi:hypothetical protein